MVNEVVLQLPGWGEELAGEYGGKVFADDEAKMGVAVELARRNIREGTGGPFGAAVFDETGRLVAMGVNRVMGLNCSTAHAEVLALSLAQRALETYDLSSAGRLTLASSAEPCAMCLGATAWSGVKRLICGARDEDARAIGFDEGDKPAAWEAGLEKRGVEVVRDVRREEARAVLREYVERGGEVYNPGQ